MPQFEHGVTALASQDFNEAFDVFNKVLAAKPRDPDALVNRGLAHAGLGHYERAITDYTTALEIDAGFQDAYLNRGAARLAAGDVHGAIDDFNEAIQLDPSDADAYRNRGFAWHAIKAWDATIVDMTQAIVLSERLDPVVFRDRADAWSAKGDREQADSDYAIADFTEALLEDASDASARLHRGTAFRDIQAFSLALIDLDEAVRLDPTNPVPHLVRGDVHGLQGESERALKDYEQAIKLDPSYVSARISRAGIMEDRGDTASALTEYIAAVERAPNHVGAISGLAWLLATSPNITERDGKRALALMTPLCEATTWQDWALLDIYAAGCAEVGEWSQAVRWATRAHSLAPSELVNDVADRLHSYEANKPHRLNAALDR